MMAVLITQQWKWNEMDWFGFGVEWSGVASQFASFCFYSMCLLFVLGYAW